jgi:hypothetical protein
MARLSQSQQLLGSLDGKIQDRLSDSRSRVLSSLQQARVDIISQLEREHVDLQGQVQLQNRHRERELKALGERVTACEQALQLLAQASGLSASVSPIFSPSSSVSLASPPSPLSLSQGQAAKEAVTNEAEQVPSVGSPADLSSLGSPSENEDLRMRLVTIISSLTAQFCATRDILQQTLVTGAQSLEEQHSQRTKQAVTLLDTVESQATQDLEKISFEMMSTLQNARQGVIGAKVFLAQYVEEAC